jgi:hypothetical protein
VVDAGIQAREIGSHDIQLDLVEGSSTGCGAKVDFSAWRSALFGNPRREIEDARQILEVRYRSAREEDNASEIAESAATPVCDTSRGSRSRSNFG